MDSTSLTYRYMDTTSLTYRYMDSTSLTYRYMDTTSLIYKYVDSTEITQIPFFGTFGKVNEATNGTLTNVKKRSLTF